MKNVLWAFLLLLITTQVRGQVKGLVKMIVQQENGTPLENATVALLKSSDSSLVKFAVAEKSGEILFENIPTGGYFIKISMVNYVLFTSNRFEVSEEKPSIDLLAIRLQKASGNLKEVVVTGRKPFIQKLSDRIVVNVDNSIVNAGSTALEVLERSPGVQIDANDVLSLRGRQGVTIMIDGKTTPMSGTDLVNMLRGMPSGSIESIHIITNPSARYDAAGNSGIIDIRMKKDQRLGYNGTITAGYGQGVFPKANAGTTFNYRNKKTNVFGNYNFGYRENLNHLFLDRNFFSNGVFNGADLKDNYAKMPFKSNNARLGVDFFPTKKTIVGFVLSGNFNHFDRLNNNNSIVINQQKQHSFTFRTKATNDDNFNNVVGNVNFKHTFDTTGKEITADIDYGEYDNNSLSSTSTDYYRLDGTTQQPSYILKGDQAGKLLLRTAKIDFVQPLKKGAKFEAGIKSSYVSSDNDAKFFDLSSGTPQNDINKTNRFFYKEYNNAGYFTFSREYKKFNIQAGLRGEQTNVSTHQVKGEIKWDSGYFQLFPSAFFNYNIKKDQTIGLSVSRRIDRPGYSQLNPFLFLIDVSTYATGNPALLPELTWSYELSYTLKSLNFTLGYSHTKDVSNIAIVRFRDVFPNIPSDENVTVQIPVNLTTSDYVGLTVAAPVRINKWWNMINNGSLYYNHFNGSLANTQLDKGKPAFDLSSNNTFTLGKGWTTELNGNFSSGGQYGFMVFEKQWGIATGVQKSLWKNKATIRLNMTDIFWTNLPKATITYNNYIERWHAERETRVANISFTYRFGKNTVAAARRRTTASEEERRRAGN
ncbi:MAG TPA: outer membrane beta-barrel protein [Flavitalea sp.]|nr:outer membrane beta-barrel protein [Flavitalea sp.]